MPRGASRYDEAQLQRRLWTPAALGGGLLAWFDFTEQGDATVSATGLTDFRDRAGRSDFSSGTSGTRPSLLPGRARGAPLVRLQNEGWFQSATDVTLTVPFVAVAAFAPDSSLGGQARFLTYARSAGDGDGAVAALQIIRRQNNAAVINTFQRFTEVAVTSCTFDSTPIIFAVQCSATGAVTQWLNGAAGGTGTLPTTTFDPGAFIIGATARNSAQNFLHNINSAYAGAVVCTGEVIATTATRERIEGFLAWRAGWQDRLVASHPYRNTPPLIGG